MKLGKFIVFEGIDGAGTTSQAQQLVNHLVALGQPTQFTAEPSQGPIGRFCRQALMPTDQPPFSGEVMALLFAADRRLHIEREILPLLQKGIHVVCDRYVLSSIVYQVTAGANEDFVKRLNQDFLIPDITFVLDVSADVALARRQSRLLAEEIYENQAFQSKIATLYRDKALSLPQANDKVSIVNSNKTFEEVASLLLEKTKKLLSIH